MLLPFFEIGEKKIEYYASRSHASSSRDPFIVFIHGSGGTYHPWIPLLDLLSEFCNALAISLTGHGGSTPQSKPSIDSYVKDVDDVLSQLPAPPILCGHSLGGAIVITYALLHPEKIRGIILVGTGAKLRVSQAILNMLRQNPAEYITLTTTSMFSKRFQEEHKEKVRQYTEWMTLSTPEIRLADFEACDTFNRMEDISHISLPTLILVGEKDFMTPPKYAVYLQEQIPSSSLEIVPEAGHLVPFEKPKELASLIKKFVRKL